MNDQTGGERAPVVTISGSRGQGDGPDLLSAGPVREPRHLPPGVRKVLRLVAVLAVVVAVPAMVVADRQHRLDVNRADVAAIRLVTVPQPIDLVARQVPLSVRNAGPTALTVKWLQVEQAGLGQQDLRRAVLQPGTDTDLSVDVDQDCKAGSAATPPPSVLVRLQTPRGNEETLRLGTAGSPFASAYQRSFTTQCGILAVTQALRFTQGPPQVRGGSVQVSYRLHNVLGDPVKVLAALQADGLSLRQTGVPTTLGRDATGEVMATYRVTDCAQARVTYAAPAADVPVDDVTPPLYFNLEARHTVVHQTPLLGVDLASALRELVAQHCPG